MNAVSIGTPLVGTAAAFLALPFFRPSAFTGYLALGMTALTGIGIGIGLHRYYSHRAFETSPTGRALLAFLGTSAMQGPIVRWVADHRRHHRYSDAPHDPHSPHWRSEGSTSRLRGLLHAHLGWMWTAHVTSVQKYAADVHGDPIASWASRRYWWICAGWLLLPAAAGYAYGGPAEALASFLWAGCVRVTLLHNITWSINSMGHSSGRRATTSKDQSRDNAVLALLLLGEGLHNYHHRHPRVAVNAPLSLDAGGLLLLLLERFGLIWNVRRANAPREELGTD